MNLKTNIFDEVAELISDGQDEIVVEKKVSFDKTTGQASIKIPKSLSLKAGIKEDSTFEIIFNPKKETMEKLEGTNLLIKLREEKDGEKREGA